MSSSSLSAFLSRSGVQHYVVASKTSVWYHGGDLSGGLTSDKLLFLAADREVAEWYETSRYDGSVLYTVTLTEKRPPLDIRGRRGHERFVADLQSLGIATHEPGEPPEYFWSQDIQDAGYDPCNPNDAFYLPKVREFYSKTHDYVIAMDLLENGEYKIAIVLNRDCVLSIDKYT